MDIKDIQSKLLDIYKIIDEICKKYNLKLFVTGGTVIGAVRHKGFIPWDDDIDLALSRDDFREFARVASKELPNYLKLRWMKRGQHYIVIDTRHEIILDNEWSGLMNDGEKAYIFVDIQPFDGVPDNKVHRLVHCIRVMFNRMCFKMYEKEKVYSGANRPGWEKLCIKIVSRFNFLLKDENKLIEKYSNSMQKYSYLKSNYIADFCGHYHFKDVYPKKWWEPGLMMEFEDVMVRIPSEYHKYLSRIYGDYMQIPDENKRVVHSSKFSRE